MNNMATRYLGVWDYVVFALTVFITILLGSYRIYKDRIKNIRLDYFLFAGRTSGIVPIVLSSVATFMSGISLLGTPSEAYLTGVSVLPEQLSSILSYLLFLVIYMPVYYKLEITSVMEYIELRFNRGLRMFSAGFYVISQVTYNAVVLQMPALALNQVTGIGVWETMAPMAIICTLYTAMGGFKTVLWTDAFQASIMFATMFLVVVRGMINIGGVGILWERLSNGNRSTFAYFTPEPTVRFTVWALFLGNITARLVVLTSQTMVQRQWALKTLNSAKMSVYGFTVVTPIFDTLCGIFGLIIYARYYNCDPLLFGEITSRDQLSPHYAMEILQDFPGLGGFFVGGLVAATLSTLSSNINSLSLIVLQDFIKPFYGDIPDKKASKISSLLAGLIGAISLAFVVLFENFDSALQATYAARSIAGGPVLGVTTLGMLIPFASTLGAVVGCISGSAAILWLIIGSTVHKYIQPYEPLGISGCNGTSGFNYTSVANYSSPSYIEHNASIFPFYTTSFRMYVAVSFIPVIFFGIIVSLITGPQNPDKLHPGVTHPAAKKFFQKLPNCLKFKIGYKCASNDGKEDTTIPVEEEMMNVSKGP